MFWNRKKTLKIEADSESLKVLSDLCLAAINLHHPRTASAQNDKLKVTVTCVPENQLRISRNLF